MRPAAALVVAMTLLTGCGSDRPEPVEDATLLEQNLPTEVEGVRVVAYNPTEDSGVVAVDGERTEVAVGDVIGVGGVDFEIVQIVPDGDAEGPDGWISIREQ